MIEYSNNGKSLYSECTICSLISNCDDDTNGRGVPFIAQTGPANELYSISNDILYTQGGIR